MTTSGGSGHSRDTAAERERAALRTVFSETPVPQILLREDGTIRRVNQAAAALLGVGSGYAAGRALGTFLAPEHRAELRDGLAAVLGARRGSSFDVLLREGSRSRPARLVLTPIAPAGDPDVQVLVTAAATAEPRQPGPGFGREVSGAQVEHQLDRLHQVSDALVAALVEHGEADPQTRVRAVSAAFDAWALLDAGGDGPRRRLAVCAPDPEFGKHVRTLTDLVAPEGQRDLVDEVFARAQPVLISQVEDPAALGHFPDGRAVLDLLEGSSLLILPGLDDSGQVVRVLSLVRRPDRPPFTLADLGLAQRLSRLASGFVRIGEVLAAERQLRTDLLTALTPRRIGPLPGWEIAATVERPDGVSLGDAHLLLVEPDAGGGTLLFGRAVGAEVAATSAALAVQHGARALLAAGRPAGELFAATGRMLADQHPGCALHLIVASLRVDAGQALADVRSAGSGGTYLVRPDGSLADRDLLVSAPLGASDRPMHRSYQVASGDLLVLVADSTMTATDECGEPFADTLAPRALARHAGEPPGAALDALVRAYRAACPGAPAPAALALRRTG